METHVMTFFMPPSSGLCVKSCLRCNDISASPSAPCCFSKMLAWNAHNSSALTLRWCCMRHTESAPNSRSPHRQERLSCAKKERKGFQGRDFIVCLLSFGEKNEWSGRGTSAKQMKICRGGVSVGRQLQETQKWSVFEAACFADLLFEKS